MGPGRWQGSVWIWRSTQGWSLPPAPSAYGRELRPARQPCWGWCLGGAFERRLPWCWRMASEGNLVRMVLCLWRLGRGPWWIHFWIGLKEFWLCRWHPCVSVLWILGEPPLCCPGSGIECSSKRALDCCPLRLPGDFCLCAASELASAPSWGL